MDVGGEEEEGTGRTGVLDTDLPREGRVSGRGATAASTL